MSVEKCIAISSVAASGAYSSVQLNLPQIWIVVFLAITLILLVPTLDIKNPQYRGDREVVK